MATPQIDRRPEQPEHSITDTEQQAHALASGWLTLAAN
jgi:hypothetical protein